MSEKRERPEIDPKTKERVNVMLKKKYGSELPRTFVETFWKIREYASREGGVEHLSSTNLAMLILLSQMVEAVLAMRKNGASVELPVEVLDATTTVEAPEPETVVRYQDRLLPGAAVEAKVDGRWQSGKLVTVQNDGKEGVVLLDKKDKNRVVPLTEIKLKPSGGE